MERQPFSVEPLSPIHDRRAFACGEVTLDRYLREQARQDVDRRIASVYVMVERGTGRVAGYYTLSACAVTAAELPAETLRKLPRDRELPATLLGRLAIDRAFQKQRIGESLLFDAGRRTDEASGTVAAFALLVDALDDRARAFYERYGFLPLTTNPRRLFLPTFTIVRLLERM